MKHEKFSKYIKKRWEHPEYAEFITRHKCIDCGDYNAVDKYGIPRVDASHVKTKGSGGKEYNNLIPQCRKCHQAFENKTKYYRREYIKMAEKFTEMYFDAVMDTLPEDSYLL